MNKPYLRQDQFDAPIETLDNQLKAMHARITTPKQLTEYHELMLLLETAELSIDVVEVYMAIGQVRERLDGVIANDNS